MAIKNIMARGIGFTSEGTKWIPTAGYSSATPPTPPDVRWFEIHRGRLLGTIDLVFTPFNSRRY